MEAKINELTGRSTTSISPLTKEAPYKDKRLGIRTAPIAHKERIENMPPGESKGRWPAIDF